MHDDSSSPTVFDEGSQQVVTVIVRQKVAAELPAKVWAKSLPTNEFFSILLDEANVRIGQRNLNKIGKFRVYLDTGDAIGESKAKLLDRLERPIEGVAEMSADRSTIHFNCWDRVFAYLRTIAKHLIISTQRKHTTEIELKCDDYESLCELLTPVESVNQKIKILDHSCWIKAIESDVSKLHQDVLLLQLKGLRRAKIVRLLGITPAKLKRIKREIISCFRRKFTSPIDLLEAMQS